MAQASDCFCQATVAIPVKVAVRRRLTTTLPASSYFDTKCDEAQGSRRSPAKQPTVAVVLARRQSDIAGTVSKVKMRSTILHSFLHIAAEHQLLICNLYVKTSERTQDCNGLPS